MLNVTITEARIGRCPRCTHCKTDKETKEFLEEYEDLCAIVVQEAKDFFGSVNRDDTRGIIQAVGDLLVHENHLPKY